jgi:SpoVK/Ycf46/Vps4 family AAA+-type ATPase
MRKKKIMMEPNDIELKELNDIELQELEEEEAAKFDSSKINAFKALECICIKAKESHLTELFFRDANIKTSIEEVQKLLPLNELEVVVFALVSAYTIGNDGTTLSRIGEFLNINPFRLYDISHILSELVDKGYIEFNLEQNFNDTNEVYTVNKNVLCAIREGKIPNIKIAPKLTSSFELVRKICNVLHKNMLDKKMIYQQIINACEKNKEIGIVKKMDEHRLDNFERLLIISLIDQLIVNGSDLELGDCGPSIFNGDHDLRYQLKNYFYDKKCKLIKLGYIEIIKGNFTQDDSLHLTEKGLKEMMGDEAKRLMKKSDKNEEMNRCTLIKPSMVKHKDLIYDEKTSGQISMLKDMLSKTGMKRVQKSLKDEGLRAGINVLLYGCPGTGKTETVLQLCKEMGRNILQVNISEMKSKWFGDSEKIVSRVFKQYEKMVKESKMTPILLFNEADAVLSKRLTLNDNNATGQTENAVQNILLQAFEENEGIIICTTNLTDNLDAAFSRRFLFKVEFTNPDLATRTKLVNLKLGKYLTLEQCREIASKYELTGGVLDNVLTKIVTKKCLHGEKATFEEIGEFCRQDTFYSMRQSIKGFGY